MNVLITAVATFLCTLSSCSQPTKPVQKETSPLVIEKTVQEVDHPEWNKLTKEEAAVIIDKGTEYPNSGKYLHTKEKGVYVCKRCNTPLFNSQSKFDSGTGWPSFDAFIDNNVEELLDADGRRSEVICNVCKGHLGHVFEGEGFTKKNIRHCVNSVSLDFVPNGK